MASAELQDDGAEQALLEEVAEILLTLCNIGLGDYECRLTRPEHGSTAMVELTGGINQMIAALAEERERVVSYERELEGKLSTIAGQRAAIRELSTPILEVWEDVLCLPVVGVIDTMRSSEMMEALLEAISRKNTRVAIIDVTAIDVMDTSTAAHFLRMAKCARLLGAECVITGMNPSIAETVVHMGVELDGVRTYRSLWEALRLVVIPAGGAEGR